MSSKMDGLRAMREAKYAANAKRGAAGAGSGAPSARKSPPVAPEAPQATARTAAPVPTPEDAPAEGTEALCGHRNMGGRTCTREAGHAAKSHRYS
jgi:hypothetical protein